VYEFYFASCMNIIFNELCQQRVKYDVHTTTSRFTLVYSVTAVLCNLVTIADQMCSIFGSVLWPKAPGKF